MPDQYPTKALQGYVLRSEVASGVLTGVGGGTQGPPGANGADGAPGAPWTPVQSPTAPALSSGDTIATTGLSLSRVTPLADCTGVILASGIVGGQEVAVVNETAFDITFAAVATSHVSIGTACILSGNTALKFLWDTVTARWYPEFVGTGGTGVLSAGRTYGVNFLLTGG